jgi:polysaccharide biosynthesis transport protein
MTDLELTRAQPPLTMARLKAIARREWWVVAIVAVLSVVGGTAYALAQPRSYISDTSVYTGVPVSSVAGSSGASVTYPVASDEALSGQVLAAVAYLTKQPVSEVNLSAATSPDGTVLFLSATERSPSKAVRTVLAAQQAFIAARIQDLDGEVASNLQPLATLQRKLQALSGPTGTTRPGAVRGTTATTLPNDVSVEAAVLAAQYSALYSEQVQLELAAQAVRPAQTGTPSSAPVARGTETLLLVALGAGLLAGCGIALLRDLVRDELTDPAEVPELAELPLLGELPNVRLRRRQTLLDIFDGRLGEAARELRAGIALAPTRRPLKTFLVSSGSRGEGKSFVAANLAIANALNGARTVLVSSDLRHPTLERLLGSTVPAGGLVALQGNGHGSAKEEIALDWIDVVSWPTALEGLSLVNVGPISANPVDLLSSKAMAELLGRLREEADVVILDSPPLLAVADAQVLSGYADAVLLVVATRRSSKGEVRQALRIFERNRAHMLGFVMTGVAQRVPWRYRRYSKTGFSARKRLPAHKQGVTKARAPVG